MARITSTSRYKGSTVTTIDNEDVVLLKKLVEVPFTDEDFYVILEDSTQRRPDIISTEVYGTPEYGWAIMELNGITNFLDLKSGTKLRIPPIDVIREAVAESHNFETKS